MDLDFTCEVSDCTQTQKLNYRTSHWSRYCQAHTYMYNKYGSPTPEISCGGCFLDFTYGSTGSIIAKLGGDKHYCPNCALIWTTYKHLLPKNTSRITTNYKISLVQYLKILVAQGLKCALCDEKPLKFVVDHDHTCCVDSNSCGKCVRGLLCGGCNVSIGHIEKLMRLGLLTSISGPVSEYLCGSRVLK